MMARKGLLLLALLVAAGISHAAGRSGRPVAETPLLGPRLLHYPLKCHAGERCQVECFQGGRVILTRIRLEPADSVRLVLSEGLSERLVPLWIVIRPRAGGVRTVLLPGDALCDLQGLTVEPFSG